MKVLMLSIDATIADPKSISFKRMKEQSSLVDELVVLVLKKGKEYRIIEDNLKIWSSPLSDKFFSTIWAYNKARDLIKQLSIEVITAQDPFFLGSLARKLAIKFDVGYEIQLHGDFFSNEFWKKEKWINKFLFNIGLKNLKTAGSIRTVSNRIKNDLVNRGFNKNRIVNVPIHVPWQDLRNQVVRFSMKERYPQFEFIALSLGRLEKVKNIDLLLLAWKKFIASNTRAGLIIVGSGSEEKDLKKLARILNIVDNVVFEPITDDVVSYYRGADCFVLTSYYEGWARTVIEAMACDCVVIMTDVGCAGEIVKDRESGLVVPVGDEKALLTALINIKKNPELRRQLVLNVEKSFQTLSNQEKIRGSYLASWEKAKKPSFKT